MQAKITSQSSLNPQHWERFVLLAAFMLSVCITYIAYQNNFILAYGDAESHLNISKRIIHSITPGFAQLGGVWLPLPHLLMVPFVSSDLLWHTGLAGSIVSGIAFLISGLYIFKLLLLLTKHLQSSFIGFVIFALNPNILYMQSTPMTEIPFIMFFILTVYFFYRFLDQEDDLIALTFSAIFSFCASLTRYEGWFIVLLLSFILGLNYIDKRHKWLVLEAKSILYSSIGYFGIILWLMWDLIILGDPLYFTNSIYSAKSQQRGFLARGELPAYHNIPLATVYYVVTSAVNIGYIISLLAVFGCVIFLTFSKQRKYYFLFLLLLAPFFFNIITLVMGQSIIFIPELTPEEYEWRLFNVRYGILMVPAAAFFTGYLFFHFRNLLLRLIIIFCILLQSGAYYIGKADIVTLSDGISGLSASRPTDAEFWLKENYDGGLILVDDYSRSFSLTRNNISPLNTIYIGNSPFWEESLENPEKHARWVIVQRNDSVWKALYINPEKQKQLYQFFNKAYESPDVIVFKRQ